jgi:hypothetical protein
LEEEEEEEEEEPHVSGVVLMQKPLNKHKWRN